MEAEADKVWVPHPTEIWQPAEVIVYDDKTKKFTVEKEENGNYTVMEIHEDKTMSYDADHEKDFENAFKMGDLNEPALLNLLKARSIHDNIYTFTGDILLSVNPYKRIENLYEPMPKPGELKSESEDAAPHLYVLAERAYTALYASGLKGTSQSVLINGESGAGKTEAAKRIMAFLMELSQRKRAEMAKKGRKGKRGKGRGGKRPGRNGGMAFGGFGRPSINFMRRSTRRAPLEDIGKKDEDTPLDREQSKIEKIILKTNPLMEAFGNARTIRNDNSSRFGKFVQLEYDQDGSIKGARTRHFLLEKSRIVKHGRGERNYHAFYQMCAMFEQAPDDPVFEDIQMLKPSSEYKYLNAVKSQAVEIDKRPVRGGKAAKKKRDGVKIMADRAAEVIEKRGASLKKMDRTEYLETAKSLTDIRVEIEDQKNIWRVLTAILTMGNLEFVSKEVEEDGRSITVCDVQNENGELEEVANLLGVEMKPLKNALCKRTIKAGRRGSVTTLPLSVDEAIKSRDGLAKAMYEALFEWLLDRINQATGTAVAAIVNQGGKKKKQSKKNLFIGILDIFGFEMLEDNSFEQLCINYANEALQGMFDNHVFDLESESYKKENIIVKLPFRTNTELLEMLDSQGKGLFQLMDEQGALGNRGSDEGFLKAVQSNYGDAKPRNPRFGGTEFAGNGRLYFQINHFAGQVEYTASGMVEKNADHLQPDLADLIADGGMPIDEADLKALEAEEKAEINGRSKSRTEKTKSIKSTKSSRSNKSTTEKSTDGDLSPEEVQDEKFHFLQMILKLREEKNTATDEKAPAKGNKKAPKRKKMAKLQSVSLKFRRQMGSLQALLDDSEQHFVRCIKPNDEKVPPQEKWDTNMVNAQLNMLGAFEMVRMRRLGFPARSQFDHILVKYYELRAKYEIEWQEGVDDRQACAKLMNAFDEGGKGKHWHLGDSQCFMREATQKQMDDMERTIREEKADKEERMRRREEARMMEIKKRTAQVKIAKIFRGYRERKVYAKRIQAIVKLQANVRRVIVKKQLGKRSDAATKIAAMVRGQQYRKRFAAISKLVKFRAVARGVLTRIKYKRVLEMRNPFKALLKDNEVIVMMSPAMLEASAKMKRRNTALLEPHRLIMTSGPVPRILFVNTKKVLVKAEIEWDSKVVSGLASNEHKIVIYSKPGGNNMRRFWSFVFPDPVSVMWMLALQNVYTIYDLMRLQKVDPKAEDQVKHGGVSPLTPDVGYIFGGPTALGGLDQVYHYANADLTQLSGWRPRYFVLKGTALYWFKSEEAKFPMGALSLNGSCAVTLGRAAKTKIYNKSHKAKQSIEIESQLLRNPIRINCKSDKERQRFMNKVKKAVNRRKDFHKRHSVSKGVISNKAFKITEDMFEAMDAEEEDRTADDDREDIEQPHDDIAIP